MRGLWRGTANVVNPVSTLPSLELGLTYCALAASCDGRVAVESTSYGMQYCIQKLKTGERWQQDVAIQRRVSMVIAVTDRRLCRIKVLEGCL